MQFVIIIGVIVLIAVGAYFSHQQEKKRREALAALAARLGWRFNPDKDKAYSSRFPQFERFRNGHSRYAHNRLSGGLVVDLDDGSQIELPAEFGDYHYRQKQGKNTHTYRFSYLLLRVPCGATHDLVIRGENMGDKMKAALGFDDIDFESVEFSDRYYVQSRDKRFAYDVIHPRMIEFLLAGHHPEIVIDGGLLCLTSSGKRWEPGEFPGRLEWAKRFFGLWPRHLHAPQP